jgi:hypothetical protein
MFSAGRNCGVAVDEIHRGTWFDLAQYRVLPGIALARMDSIPTDVGHLMGFPIEANRWDRLHMAWNQAKTFMVTKLLGPIHHHLHSEANPKERATRSDEIMDWSN